VSNWALVTGCFGPVGISIAQHLRNAGFKVLGTDLVVEETGQRRKENTEGQPPDIFISVDLSSSQAIDAAIRDIEATIPSLSVLVNNAAMTNPIDGSRTQSPTADEFAQVFQVNATAPFMLSTGLQSLMQQSRDPSIINVASIYGLVGPVTALYEGTAMTVSPAYAASKGALVQITRYLATVMAPTIRVNAVAPGGIERQQPPSFVKKYQQQTPLGRMGTEADVAAAVCWLASSGSRYVTGQVIAVDGGWTAW